MSKNPKHNRRSKLLLRDVVFSGRNKKYGAYDILNTEGQRYRIAALFLFVIVLGVSFPVIKSYYDNWYGSSDESLVGSMGMENEFHPGDNSPQLMKGHEWAPEIERYLEASAPKENNIPEELTDKLIDRTNDRDPKDDRTADKNNEKPGGANKGDERGSDSGKSNGALSGTPDGAGKGKGTGGDGTSGVCLARKPEALNGNEVYKQLKYPALMKTYQEQDTSFRVIVSVDTFGVATFIKFYSRRKKGVQTKYFEEEALRLSKLLKWQPGVDCQGKKRPFEAKFSCPFILSSPKPRNSSL